MQIQKVKRVANFFILDKSIGGIRNKFMFSFLSVLFYVINEVGVLNMAEQLIMMLLSK